MQILINKYFCSSMRYLCISIYISYINILFFVFIFYYLFIKKERRKIELEQLKLLKDIYYIFVLLS